MSTGIARVNFLVLNLQRLPLSEQAAAFGGLPDFPGVGLILVRTDAVVASWCGGPYVADAGYALVFRSRNDDLQRYASCCSNPNVSAALSAVGPAAAVVP